jgi:hypothetical protein
VPTSPTLFARARSIIARIVARPPTATTPVRNTDTGDVVSDNPVHTIQTVVVQQPRRPDDISQNAPKEPEDTTRLAVRNSPDDEAKTAPELPIPVKSLPACGATGVTNVLTRIGNTRGIAVFNIYPRTLSSTANMRICAAQGWTSAGKLAVTYTVTWTNREAGRYWVQVRSYSRTR